MDGTKVKTIKESLAGGNSVQVLAAITKWNDSVKVDIQNAWPAIENERYTCEQLIKKVEPKIPDPYQQHPAWNKGGAKVWPFEPEKVLAWLKNGSPERKSEKLQWMNDLALTFEQRGGATIKSKKDVAFAICDFALSTIDPASSSQQSYTLVCNCYKDNLHTKQEKDVIFEWSYYNDPTGTWYRFAPKPITVDAKLETTNDVIYVRATRPIGARAVSKTEKRVVLIGHSAQPPLELDSRDF
jgi:hypothetical protein